MGRDDDGAVVVEMGLVAPFLLLLLFGIFEFGWMLSQNLDIDHGSREGARLAAVNYNPDSDADGTVQTQKMVATICARTDLGAGTKVTLALVSPGQDEIGDGGIITVEKPYEQLTGFLDPMIGSVVLSDQVTFRIEQDVTWNPSLGAQNCP